ncbi:receptor-like protein EIX2 [Phoenix dactylifera]|uniref:Receptor-like protein EIX2 n=1 Tax=Phoenix dactylifera TaxID=42345 RepID=A0A8B9AQQ5_PHODC|nr:receptor-like protein EIX2 [Phoenix dactylifera]
MPVTSATERSSRLFAVSNEILKSKTMMLRSTPWFLLRLLSYQTMASSSCLELERTALLAFKAGLNTTQRRLASWQGLDCCTWNGVSCDDAGHVVELDLRNPYDNRSRWALGGEIDPSLLALSRLKHLDLSMNGFGGIPIPEFIGSFTRLEYLNLSGAAFGGLGTPGLTLATSPASAILISVLPSLITRAVRVDNLHWLTRLSSLKHLDLRSVNLSTAADWLQAANMLPSLTVLPLTTLDLLDNNFNSTLPNWLWNLSSLTYLDLSSNGFHGPISESLGTLTWLQVLALGYNGLEGALPRSIKNLCSLNTLRLSRNGLGGEIAEIVPRCMWSSLRSLDLWGNKLRGNLTGWLENLTSLSFLDLSKNSLDGPIPSGIGKLSSLTYLDLSYNSFEGIVSEPHFANLTGLKLLILSLNSLILEVDPSWVPPFQLQIVGFRSCRLGPKFPAWLQSQMSIRTLDLSNTSIADAVPDWFWNSSSLSLTVLDLSNNQITGNLPLTLELMTDLYLLELSSNQLEGELPRCWNEYSQLLTLDLANNNLSGEIPSSMGSLSRLQSLHLNNNNFFGELPSSLQQCNGLTFLNLAQNKFSGNLPAWIGEGLQDLVVLQLRSNMFSGNIPPQLAELSKLQILDLGHNNLSGSIPPSFGNFSAMASTMQGSISSFEYWTFANYGLYSYNESLYIITKGEEQEYSKILYLVKSMDLSSNSLSGEIPEEIGNLLALNNLNLSRNHLTGKIPDRIGGLQSLESLDLSMNELSGTIPQSISNLTSLSHLNMSYNNLSGRIPTGYQLQTLEDPSIYVGNLDLCRPPISESCSSNETDHGNYEEYEDDDEMLWFYLSMVLGFVVGFWVVFGVLLLKSSWRNAYFQMTDNWFDRLYVPVAITIAGLKKRNMEENRAVGVGISRGGS